VTIRYEADVDGFATFYRETGPVDARVLLLLSGFPTAGHMFGQLIRALSDFPRVMPPDLPRLINRIAALTASLIALFAPWPR
jgi:pimeloyl-ACP methyl ester carboxylesterase